jgi:hypothetical protein
MRVSVDVLTAGFKPSGESTFFHVNAKNTCVGSKDARVFGLI